MEFGCPISALDQKRKKYKYKGFPRPGGDFVAPGKNRNSKRAGRKKNE
jgi:hypothetical protein